MSQPLLAVFPPDAPFEGLFRFHRLFFTAPQLLPYFLRGPAVAAAAAVVPPAAVAATASAVAAATAPAPATPTAVAAPTASTAAAPAALSVGLVSAGCLNRLAATAALSLLHGAVGQPGGHPGGGKKAGVVQVLLCVPIPALVPTATAAAVTHVVVARGTALGRYPPQSFLPTAVRAAKGMPGGAYSPGRTPISPSSTALSPSPVRLGRLRHWRRRKASQLASPIFFGPFFLRLLLQLHAHRLHDSPGHPPTAPPWPRTAPPFCSSSHWVVLRSSAWP